MQPLHVAVCKPAWKYDRVEGAPPPVPCNSRFHARGACRTRCPECHIQGSPRSFSRRVGRKCSRVRPRTPSIRRMQRNRARPLDESATCPRPTVFDGDTCLGTVKVGFEDARRIDAPMDVAIADRLLGLGQYHAAYAGHIQVRTILQPFSRLAGASRFGWLWCRSCHSNHSPQVVAGTATAT